MRGLLVVCAFMLLACSRSQPAAPASPEKSLEHRVTELEQRLNSNGPSYHEAGLRREQEKQLAEIRGMGLDERAKRDFSNRVTNAVIVSWTMGYFVDTNTVWCDFRYRLPGNETLLQKEFGYRRKEGTNWSLMWGVGAQPE